MKKIVFLIALFFVFNSFAQNQTHSDSVINSLKVKRISADSVEKIHSKVLVVGEKLPSKMSNSDIVLYVVKNQFHESPLISWAVLILLVFWIIRLGNRFLKKKT